MYDVLPARSNLGIDIPLRPKPPSEDIVQVSPSPDRYNNPAQRYGVNNPNWFSNNVPSSAPGYGPEDFVVETVNLDKPLQVFKYLMVLTIRPRINYR